VESKTVKEVFDLAVIGGGPAGTSAAITAAQLGFSVALFEAGKFPRHKVCGEFVSGEALAILDQLLGSSELDADSVRISVARIFLDGRILVLPVNPAAASVSRYKLDLALWNAAARAGAVVFDRTRARSVSNRAGLFQIETDSEKLQARAAINASGRWSNLSGRTSSNSENWIGLKGHFVEKSAYESCDLYFFDGGYCGVQPLGNGLVNAAAMVKADAARNLSTVFSLNSDLAERARRWRPATTPVSTAPLFFAPPRTSADGVILCGDAASFLDPFAGDGISMALHSGRLAALSLAPFLGGDSSVESALQAYDRAHRELIQPAVKNAARLRRLLRLPRPLRVAAMSLLRFPLLAQAAVHETRVRATA
jgi:menaquinone-9 beta-reductase